MEIAKEIRKVSIALRDNILLSGYIHINQGESILDFINDPRESFIAVTDVEVRGAKDINLFIAQSDLEQKKNCLIIIKSAILWIEELR